MARTLATPVPALLEMDLSELATWFREAQAYEEARSEAIRRESGS